MTLIFILIIQIRNNQIFLEGNATNFLSFLSQASEPLETLFVSPKYDARSTSPEKSDQEGLIDEDEEEDIIVDDAYLKHACEIAAMSTPQEQQSPQQRQPDLGRRHCPVPCNNRSLDVVRNTIGDCRRLTGSPNMNLDGMRNMTDDDIRRTNGLDESMYTDNEDSNKNYTGIK